LLEEQKLESADLDGEQPHCDWCCYMTASGWSFSFE